MKFFSIAISTYEMQGKGMDFLNFSLSMLMKQTFKDFEVIISDNSKNDSIKILCEKWKDYINIKYFKNDINKLDNPSANINNAINFSPSFYLLTDQGKTFIQRWANSEDLQ